MSAVEQDGSLRWQVDLEGPVHSLTHGGAHGAAVVGWEGADGRGVLSWLDGQTGALVHQDATPTPAPEITVSDNGEVLAVVLSDQAHFYGVRLAQ